MQFAIINKLLFTTSKVSQLEPYYTTSAREFALNVRRHLVQSVGRSPLLTMNMNENQKQTKQEIRLEFNRNLIGEASFA